MTAPNLDTDEGRAAYRRELKAFARPLRWSALALILASAAIIYAVTRGMLILPEFALQIAYGGLALGWALVLASIFLRTRHHRRRVAEFVASKQIEAAS